MACPKKLAEFNKKQANTRQSIHNVFPIKIEQTNKRGRRRKKSTSTSVNNCQQNFNGLSMSTSRDNECGVIAASNLSGSLHFLIKLDSENGEYGNFYKLYFKGIKYLKCFCKVPGRI